MSGLIRQLALVSESTQVPLSDVMRVAAALQKQAMRDLGPIWEVSATVDAFEKLEDVPLGYWRMVIKDNIGFAGAAGIHLDRDNQPFALITASTDVDTWSLTASHESVEMLVDPFGNRLLAGDSPMQGQGRVEFLVEVGDPSEAAEFGYSVNGILMSDFYTPRYFDPVRADGVRYSFTSSIKEPRQVLRGGYLSWHDPVSDHWFQEIFFTGTKSQFRDIGILTGGTGSIRSQIDRLTEAETLKAMAPGRKAATAAGITAAVSMDSVSARAAHLRKQIDAIIGGAPATARVAAAPARSPMRRVSARKRRTGAVR